MSIDKPFSLDIIDASNFKRLKGIQNISLITTIVSFVLFFISINYESLIPFILPILTISLISLALFFLLYIAHFFTKNKHKAICSHDTITIEGNSYLLSDIKLKLNINAAYIPEIKTK